MKTFEELLVDGKFLYRCWDFALANLRGEAAENPVNISRSWLKSMEVALSQAGYEIVPKQKKEEK